MSATTKSVEQETQCSKYSQHIGNFILEMLVNYYTRYASQLIPEMIAHAVRYFAARSTKAESQGPKVSVMEKSCLPASDIGILGVGMDVCHNPSSELIRFALKPHQVLRA